MATVGNSNHRRFRPSDTAKPLKPDPLDEILEPSRPFARRRVFATFLCGSLLLLVFAIALGPTIIAKTALRDRILNSVIGLDGVIDTARGSFGWFSPVVLEDIGIFDRDETTVVEAQSLTSSSTLLGLLMNGSKPGTFTISHPIIYLELRENGSNLEDVLKPILQAQGKSSTDSVGVKVIDGVVKIHDRVSNRKYELQQVKVDLAMNKKASPPIELDASASMPTEGQRATMNVAIRGGDEAGGLEQGMLDCQVSGLPLELAAPFVRRALPGAEMSGRMAIHAHGTWGEGKDRDTMTLQGKLEARNFSLAANVLGRDRLELERIELPCRVERRGSEIRVEELSLKTDVGQAAVEGTMLVKEFTPSAMIAALQSDAYRVEGNLDVARLAALLPNTLCIRKGTEITEGNLQVVLVGEPREAGIAWEGRVEAANIRAKANGKRVDWKDPLVLEFAAHQSPDGPVVDRADCTSSFLTLQGKGTLDDLEATGQFDLAELVQELEQFVDLGGLELAGAGDAKLRLQRSAGVPPSDNSQSEPNRLTPELQQAFSLRSDFNANNFALAVPGKRAWRERSLTARLDADGRLLPTKTGWQLAGVDQAQLTFEAAGEKLTARLLEPIEKLSSPLVPVQIDWQGPLAVWLSRIDPWVSTVGWDVDGGGVLKATLVYTNEGVEIRKAVVAAEPFRLSGGGLFVDERRLDAALQARWDKIAGRLEVPSAAIEADTLLVKLSRTEIRIPTAGAPTMTGTLKFDGDLAQINRWTQDPRGNALREMSGKFAGQAMISRKGRSTSARFDATVDNFHAGESQQNSRPRLADARSRDGWRERQLTVKATANYLDADDVIEIDRAEIASDALSATIEGKIERPSSDCLLDLAGTIDYDWQTLAPFWRPYLGEEVNIVGREQRKFLVRGPLPKTGTSIAGMLKPLTAEVGLAWDKAEAYGLPIGGGEIVARLDRGMVDVKPMNIAISDGQLTFAPKIRVAPEPGEVRIDKGPLLTQLRFTPEITSRFIKYAIPTFADAAQIDGQFSVDLDGGRLPIDDLAGGDIGGRLQVHSVEVLPGPLAQQILGIGKQIEDLLGGRLPLPGQSVATDRSLITLKDQTIDVRMVNRRVWHRGLQFLAGKVPIITSGSVGFDETVDMLVEFTVPNEGVGKGPLAHAVKGKTFKVPVSGTLGKFKLDDRAIAGLLTQGVGNLGKGLLLDEVGKQLDKFLPKQ